MFVGVLIIDTTKACCLIGFLSSFFLAHLAYISMSLCNHVLSIVCRFHCYRHWYLCTAVPVIGLKVQILYLAHHTQTLTYKQADTQRQTHTHAHTDTHAYTETHRNIYTLVAKCQTSPGPFGPMF